MTSVTCRPSWTSSGPAPTSYPRAGFRTALEDVWPELETVLDKVAQPIFYTGHSLGGALAMLAASRRPPLALYTFGAPVRDPRERIVSVTYFALTRSDSLNPRAASDAARVAWFPIARLPELAFDHAAIVELAHQRLVAKLHYSTIAFQLLPACFTLSQLQAVYEILLDEKQDKRNFRKAMLARGILQETGEFARSGNHRRRCLQALGR